MIDLSGAIAIVALLWTIYQQYSIAKLCEKCPFRISEQYKPNENLKNIS